MAQKLFGCSRKVLERSHSSHGPKFKGVPSQVPGRQLSYHPRVSRSKAPPQKNATGNFSDASR